MLEVLPLLAKALVATAAFAGLRHGELRGLHWTDYTGNKLSIRCGTRWVRSVMGKTLPKSLNLLAIANFCIFGD
jgi:integrase